MSGCTSQTIGTQTEAIAVSGLSLSRLPLRRLIGGEIRTGLLIGATLAILSFPTVTLMFDDVRLGISVASAVLVAGGIATTTGLVLPWVLLQLGSDPAFVTALVEGNAVPTAEALARVEARLDLPWPELIAAGHAVVRRGTATRSVRVPLERAALLAVGRAGGAVTRRQAAFVEGWVPDAG